MTEAVIVWIWGLVFFFAAIPGAVLGWIVSALFGSTMGLTSSIAISVVAGFVAAQKTYGIATPQYAIFFIPPFLVAMLLGVWISSVTSRGR